MDLNVLTARIRRARKELGVGKDQVVDLVLEGGWRQALADLDPDLVDAWTEAQNVRLV